MKQKFKLGKSLYMIIVFIFLFGLTIEFTRSELLLKIDHSNITNDRAEEGAVVEALPNSIINSLAKDPFLVLYDSSDKTSEPLRANIETTLGYMKESSLMKEIGSLEIESLSKYKAVIIAFEDIDKIQDISMVEKYVKAGGSVFFATRPSIGPNLSYLSRNLGVYEIGSYTLVEGVVLTSNILPIKRDSEYSGDWLVNSSIAVGLENKSEILIQSPTKIPLLWKTRYGEGTFMLFNGTMLSDKMNRGIISGAISKLSETYIYPIMNMKLSYIDQFPSPVSNDSNEAIYSRYSLTNSAFYRHVWWPFIQSTYKDYDMIYTASLLESYDLERKKLSGKDLEEQQLRLLKYGRELLKMEGELAINGYNYSPLILEKEMADELGYKAWKNEQEITSSLEKVNQSIKRLFPAYEVKTYVPPYNIVEKSVVGVVQEGIPTVNTISSHYLDYVSDEMEYLQEFRKVDGITYLPRITSGYEDTQKNNWALLNAMMSIGVFSHVITPNEVLNQEKKSWEELAESYSTFLSTVHKRFPWLRGMTATQASTELEVYEKAEFFVEKGPTYLKGYINGFSEQMSFILRTTKNVTAKQGCDVIKIDDGVYFIQAHSSTFEIGLGE